MSGVIKAGSSGNTAEVDGEGRLLTFSISRDEKREKATKGLAFSLTHTIVNLTSDSESSVIYAKNDDTVPWVLDDIRVSLGKSTGGNGGDFTSRITINPSGGTLLSGNDGFVVNLKVGDPGILPITIKSGVEGSNVTGGASLTPAILISDQMVATLIGGPVVLPPASAVAYSITPPAGNTSMNVKVNLLAFRDAEQ